MTSYVVGFAFFGKQVLLIEKNRPEWQKGLLNGVGGKIEDGEIPSEAMKREFEEETGAILSDSWQHAITLIDRKTGHIVYIFRIFEESDRANLINYQKTDESLSLHYWDELPDTVIYNLNWMIPLLTSDISFPISILENSPNQGLI